MMVIHNKVGRRIAVIDFDPRSGQWRISGYNVAGFATEQEAWDFWYRHFDAQTGLPKQPGRRPAFHSDLAFRI